MTLTQSIVPVVADVYDLEKDALSGDNRLRLRPYVNLPPLKTAQRQSSMAPSSHRGKSRKIATVKPGDRSSGQPGLFLRTKLLPPRPAPELLSRPRLTERLLANLSRPMTLVTANAGSGKTTLVADVLRNHGRPFVWYQLDHTDADPSVFLGYLTYGIQQIVPGF